jgi:hypothetical protein
MKKKNQLSHKKGKKILKLAESAVIETNTLESETSSKEAIRRVGTLPRP